jgi:hypothetical protein
MTFGSNMISAVVQGRDLYYLNNYLITRYQSDVQKWNLSVVPQNIGLVGLASEGNNLHGIALDPDNTSNGYLGKLKIYNISF